MTLAPENSRFSIKKPDDFHVHFRDGEMLSLVVKHTADKFARAIAMPNLIPPVTLTEQALDYKEKIIKVAGNNSFTPLMTLYLTDRTTPEEIRKAKENGITAIKYYPAGATTNSDSGVTDIKKVYSILEAMTIHNLPLLIHGEVTDPDIAEQDREKYFLENHFREMIKDFPELKMVLEHVSTKDGVDFVTQSSDKIAATCTVHHLMFTKEDLYRNGLNPHLFCKPVLKSESDRQAVVRAATSSSSKFFAGTDSAPHPRRKKEGDNPSAGIYSAYMAIECYAQIFEEAGMWNGETLENLENFLSTRGARFYGLPENQEVITLIKQPQAIPASFPIGNDQLIPLKAGKEIQWSIDAI